MRAFTRTATPGCEGDAQSMFVRPRGRSAFHEQHPWLFRWPPLLFTTFWIADTAQFNNNRQHWIGLGIFYAVFLLAYIRTFASRERHPRVWLGVLFALGYIYFPFDWNISGEFVFPIVMSVFFLRQPKLATALRAFVLIELLSYVGVALEVWLTHAPRIIAQNVIFYMIAIGLSYFAYSRHMLSSEQLERANDEIEHLAQTAERERIARDLHDLLGHTLTVIVLKSDVANRLFDIDPELAHREIAEVEETARKALAEVREAVVGYRAEGLAAEIAQARRALSSAGVQLTTDVETVPLAPREANVLCPVLREAVTNVIRHAGATACRLEVHRDGSLLRMTVQDNGNGVGSAEGNGMRGMRERLMAASGSFALHPVPGGGTRVLAELPLADATRELTGNNGQKETDTAVVAAHPAVVRG